MAIKRPSEKNTKSEILASFEELLKEKKALETQLAQKAAIQPVEPVNGKAIAVVEPPPKPPQPEQKPEQKMESIIAGLSQLQLGFGSAISDLSEKLVLEAMQLQDIRESLTDQTLQLETLHNLEFNETSLDDLIQNYEENSKTFSEARSLRQTEITQAVNQARKAWEKEQEEQRRSLKERNEIQTKTAQRDAKEYHYDVNLQRKITAEEYDLEQNLLYQELQESQQSQEKAWATREQEISDRETQFAELKAKVEAMPKDLETAIKRAKEEGKGIANQQAKIKADLLAKETEGQQKTSDLRVDFLQETIADQQARLQTLTKQLDAALKQVQDLAVKAIEGASDMSSFEAVREIALEQAKNQNKAK